MFRRVELWFGLWSLGVPVVLMVWALLRLAAKAPARVRYLMAIGGFAATLLVPLWSPSMPAAPVPPVAGRIVLPHAETISGIVNVTWLAGAILLLLRDVIGHARLRRTRGALQDAPAALKCATDWPSSVPLLVSRGAAPFTIGLLRPAVVLPADLLERFPIEVVRRIARHEWSHARWHDPLAFAILRIVAALFWVSPVWLVLRWVRREREAAADECALQDARGEEKTYVEALLRLSRFRPSRALAAAMAASDLEYRARRMLVPQHVSLTAVLVLVLGVLLLSVAACVQLDDGEPIVIREKIVHRHVDVDRHVHVHRR